jgi:hypothetical protein
VSGRVGAEPPRGLLELALTADLAATAGLVPGDGDVDEALQEVPLGGLGAPPRVLEGLVRGEPVAGAQELEPADVVGVTLRGGRRGISPSSTATKSGAGIRVTLAKRFCAV